MSPLAGAAALALGVLSSQPLRPPRGVARASEVPVMRPGSVGELSVTIMETPAPGVPIELRLDATHVRLVEKRLGWGSVVDPLAVQPRVRTRFTAPEHPGAYVVLGQVSYVTCDADVCLPHVASVRWTVRVEAEPEPASQ